MFIFDGRARETLSLAGPGQRDHLGCCWPGPAQCVSTLEAGEGLLGAVWQEPLCEPQGGLCRESCAPVQCRDLEVTASLRGPPEGAGSPCDLQVGESRSVPAGSQGHPPQSPLLWPQGHSSQEGERSLRPGFHLGCLISGAASRRQLGWGVQEGALSSG